ncbi:MFS-type transporter SLC18B1-like [Ornithodoros turicata]|uniref:MFS-type transporter SLC18B1-like n=1 Tax=Ornithodoros turicata TaxID=34597 RepID=UPI003138655F
MASSFKPGQDVVCDDSQIRQDNCVSQPKVKQSVSGIGSLPEDSLGISGASPDITKAKPPKSLLTRVRRKVWLLPVVHTHFWFSACTALLAPYFPPLAASKGLSAWKYGFVFSTFKTAMLLGSMATERLMVYIAPSRVYLSGQVGFFTFVVVFGVFYWVPGGDVFLGLAIPVAFFGGFVSGMYAVSMYSLVTERFTGNTGLIIALMEVSWGGGNLAGSILGGVLIDVWQYPLPFFVIGTILMLSAPVIAIRGPIPEEHRRAVPESASTEDVKYHKALCDPVFLIAMVTVMLSWVIMSFNEPTLEPYLQQFNLSSTGVGTFYTVQFAGYSVGALPSGILCSIYNVDEFLMFLAMCLTALAYLIQGPAPFLPGPPTLWMIYLSQVFTGMGMAAQFVCSYSYALKRLKKKGYPDTIRTSGFVSSCVFTSLVFGAITTPPIAGYLVEKLGYRMGTMPLFGILVLWSCVTFLLWMDSLCCNSSPGARKSSLDVIVKSINRSADRAGTDVTPLSDAS